MASNPTPDNEDIALALAEDMADGCHLLEVTLGIKQNTEAKIRAAINQMLQKRQAFAVAVIAREGKYEALQLKDDAGVVVLTNCKLRLAKLFGQKANSQWASAGWPQGKTGIPDSQDKRFTLLNKLKVHFTANPAHESAEMEATAALCEAAHGQISVARTEVNAAEGAESTALNERRDALKVLRKVIRGLISELEQLIAEDDVRWRSFGLNVPANPSPPEGIETLTLTAIGGGKVLCQWSYASRMTGTRIMFRVPGPDVPFVSKGTADGLEKTLEGLAPGTVVEIKVVPYNDAGDGLESSVETVVVV